MAIKCKNSVFCVLFLVLFLSGTICGILLFRLFAGGQSGWLRAYFRALGPLTMDNFIGVLFCWCRPLLVIWLLGMLPAGPRVIPLMIVIRGILTAYSAAAYFAAGLSPGSVALRGLTVLPAYYLLCRRAMGQKERERVRARKVL